MSALPPKAEVGIYGADVRYVPLPEVAIPVEEPSTASKAEVPGEAPLSMFCAKRRHWRLPKVMEIQLGQ